MKSLLIATILSLSVSVFANHHEEMEGKSFEEIKKMMLEHTDRKLADIQAHKACVTAAADKDALRKCREEMRSKRKEMKQAMHSKHEAMKTQKDAMKANKKK